MSLKSLTTSTINYSEMNFEIQLKRIVPIILVAHFLFHFPTLGTTILV